MPYRCEAKFMEVYIQPYVEPTLTERGVVYLDDMGTALRGPGLRRPVEHLLLYWHAHQINAGTVLT